MRETLRANERLGVGFVTEVHNVEVRHVVSTGGAYNSLIFHEDKM